MSLEKSEVAAVVEHCAPVNDLVRGGLQAVHESFKVLDLEKLNNFKTQFAAMHNLSDKDVSYFVFKGKLKNQAYNKESEPISILKKDKTVENIVDSSDQLQVRALSKAVTKYFICFPKVLLEV